MSLRKSVDDDLNSKIINWANETKSKILSEISSLGITHSKNSPSSKPLKSALKQIFRKKYEDIDEVAYKMPKSAIYLHKGVSRGHGKNNKRQAKEWFNPIVDSRIGELVNIVATEQGNRIVNNLKIK